LKRSTFFGIFGFFTGMIFGLDEWACAMAAISTVVKDAGGWFQNNLQNKTSWKAKMNFVLLKLDGIKHIVCQDWVLWSNVCAFACCKESQHGARSEVTQV
jgi:hypothetical protein